MRGARRDSGASAAEYALLVTLIAAVIVAVVYLLGDVIRDVFSGDPCDERARRAGTAPAECDVRREGGR